MKSLCLSPKHALLAAPIALMTFAAQGHDRPTIQEMAEAEVPKRAEITLAPQKIDDSLTVLMGQGGFSGGNVLVSNGPDGMLIIDDKLPTMTDKLTEALDDIGGSAKLKYVLNTHWHLDHTGGNTKLGETATIVAHTNVRKRLSTDQRVDVFDMVIPPQPASALPQITYDEGLSIHFNGDELRLMHMPASHTDTDTVIHLVGANVMHTGDLFFNGLFPFVDVQNGGNVLNLTKSIATLIETMPADVTIVPGHGPMATMDDLKNFHRMLEETTANVVALKEAGKSEAEIKQAGVPEKWAGWAWRLDAATWNGIILSSL
ncbi:MAG: MBL fold metallo-hydrolase [Magnetovibrionaceae bacterium]